MALTSAQQAQLLFKQSQGKSSTNVVRDFFEEPRDGRAIVYPTSIWAEFGRIPTTAPGGADGVTTGVVTRYIDKILTAVPGTSNSFYDATLVDCIPFNTGDGSYNYVLKDSAGNSIPFGQGDWLVDPNTGTLTFYGSVPSNMPPKISFYKYVGIKGALPPRYTTAQRDLLPSPFAGQQIFNTTTNQLNVYSGTSWAAVGAGGGTGVTFLGNGTFDNDVESWFNFNDSTAFVDGTGGTVVGGGVQNGGGSTTLGSAGVLAWNPGAQGFQGFSKNAVIPGAYQGQIMELTFHYIPYAPASYNDGDLKVAFYDIDNNQILTCIEGDSIKKTLLPFKHRAKVQLPAGYNAAVMNIRVSIYQTNTNVAYSYFYLDNLTFGPQLTTTGFAASDLISVGVNTIGATTTAPTKGTVSVDTLQYARRGDHALIKMSYAQSAVGPAAVGSGDYLFSLPPGLSFDPNKVLFYTTVIGTGVWPTNNAIGTASVTGGAYSVVGKALPYDATRYRIVVQATQGLGSGAVGSAFLAITNTPLTYEADFMAPIAGWSSNTVASSDAGDGRPVFASAHVGTGASTAAGAPVNFEVVDYDSHNRITTGAGVWKYTVPFAGIYHVSVGITSGQNTAWSLYKNGVLYRQLCYQNGTYLGAPSSTSVQCSAGDTLFVSPQAAATPAAVGGGSVAQNNWFCIHLLNTGNQQITATETIAARYTSIVSQAFSTTPTTVSWATRDYDTHGAWNGTTFTAPAPGLYSFMPQYAGNCPSVMYFDAYKNGALYQRVDDYYNDGGNAGPFLVGEPMDVRLLTGETIQFKISSNTGAPTSTTTAGYMAIAIKRVGNF